MKNERFKNIILIAVSSSFGFSVAFLGKSFLTKKESSPFSIQTKGVDIVIRIRENEVVRIKDQVTHYKFFLTGKSTPFKRALVGGSIDSNGLVALMWQNNSQSDVTVWNWLAEDGKITTEKRPEGLEFGDIFVDH